MRALVQRVTEASVSCLEPDGGREVTGDIGRGLVVLVGVTHDDTDTQAKRLADKVWHLRVFDDADGTMNLAAADIGAEVLVVSQFTLYADVARGRRPSYVAAARPEHAAPLVDRFVAALEQLGAQVATGRFGADMQVALVNDGPVTIGLEV